MAFRQTSTDGECPSLWIFWLAPQQSSFGHVCLLKNELGASKILTSTADLWISLRNTSSRGRGDRGHQEASNPYTSPISQPDHHHETSSDKHSRIVFILIPSNFTFEVYPHRTIPSCICAYPVQQHAVPPCGIHCVGFFFPLRKVFSGTSKRLQAPRYLASCLVVRSLLFHWIKRYFYCLFLLLVLW